MRLGFALLAVAVGGASAQLYAEDPLTLARIAELQRRTPYHSAHRIIHDLLLTLSLFRRMKAGVPWLRYTAWPWLNEHVDLEGDPLGAGQNIADTMGQYCAAFRGWLATQGDVISGPCLDSIGMLGCDFLDYLGAGLQPCDEDDCVCIQKKKDTLTATKWATQVVDAFGKIPSSLEDGNFIWLGDWEMCTKVMQIAETDNKTVTYEGAYGDLHFILAESVDTYIQDACLNTGSSSSKPGSCDGAHMQTIQLGVCAPATCTIADQQNVAAAVFHQLHIGVCDKDDNTKYFVHVSPSPQWQDHPGSIFMTLVVAAVGLTLLAATVFDEIIYEPAIEHLPERRISESEQQRGDGGSETSSTAPSSICLAKTKGEYYDELSWYLKSLLCFSMTRNVSKIMNTDSRPGQMGAVHSIRVLSMFWVIFGHTYLFAVGIEDNLGVMVSKPEEFSFEVVNNATVSVDAFFVLSGFLLGYLFFKKAARDPDSLKSWRFWVMYYVHRFVRLTPVYMLVLGCIAALWPLTGDGPFWKGFQHQYVVHCSSTSVLTNLFYVNNLFRVDQQCMGWSWYLANDMQFYWLAPPLLILLQFYPMVGMGASGALLLLNFLVRALFDNFDKLPPTVINTVDKRVFAKANDYFQTFYIRPYFRYAPFVIGVVLGWLYLRAEKKRIKIHPWLRFFAWVALFWGAFAIVFGLYDYVTLADATTFSDTGKAIFNGLNRTVFGLVVAGVIFLCLPHLKDDGCGLVESMIRSLLEWPGWQPMSRLTYCAYLIHPMVIMYFYGTSRTPEHLGDYNMMYIFLSAVTVSYSLAMLLSIAFEAPVMGLEKLWLNPEKLAGSDTRSTGAPPQPRPTSGMAPVRDKLDEVRFRFQEGLRSLHGSRDLGPATSGAPLVVTFSELAHEEAEMARRGESYSPPPAEAADDVNRQEPPQSNGDAQHPV